MADGVGLSRRKVLIGGSMVAGLVVAWGIWPRDYRPNLVASDGEEVFNAFLKIGSNGQVTVAVPQTEMGQGVFTLLPQILADELGADWRTIAVEPAPISPIYANKALALEWAETLVPGKFKPVADHGFGRLAAREIATRTKFIVTADSTSLEAYTEQFREAGAAARILLAKAAARRWDVGWESIEVEKGLLSWKGESLTFGELAVEAGEEQLPIPLPLRPSGMGGLIGKDVDRLDVPAKLDGSANFAGDIRLPDMVFAAIRQGPVGRTKLKSYNRQGAKNILGFIDAVDGGGWLATVASNWWAANRALDALEPVFETTGLMPSSEDMEERLEAALDKGPGRRFLERGALKPVFDDDNMRGFRARYQVAPAHHAAIETRSATAQLSDGRLQLWMATQAPAAAVAAAAKAIGISESKVALYPMLAGGSFGRDLDSAIAGQVAKIASEVARPVQLVYSRAEEMMHDHFRAPAHARLDAAMDKAGRVRALQIKVAAPAAAREQSARLFHGLDADSAMRAANGEADKLAVAGAEPPYAIDNLSVDHHPAYVGLPTGNWRSNAHSYNAFFVESFMDELAEKAGVEPLSYRMQYMNDQPRLARCLTDVAAMAGWDGGLDSSGHGLACHSMRGGHIALIARASRTEEGLKVRRISAKVDIGRIIHPDIARQQIEGGIVFGLAMALGSAVPFENGVPTGLRLRDLSLPRLAEVPEIQVEFVRSDEEPAGYEELGVPATAPAVANALHSATGVRFRRLPLFSENL